MYNRTILAHGHGWTLNGQPIADNQGDVARKMTFVVLIIIDGL
jgi:hypothetical protein